MASPISGKRKVSPDIAEVAEGAGSPSVGEGVVLPVELLARGTCSEVVDIAMPDVVLPIELDRHLIPTTMGSSDNLAVLRSIIPLESEGDEMCAIASAAACDDECLRIVLPRTSPPEGTFAFWSKMQDPFSPGEYHDLSL